MATLYFRAVANPRNGPGDWKMGYLVSAVEGEDPTVSKADSWPTYAICVVQNTPASNFRDLEEEDVDYWCHDTDPPTLADTPEKMLACSRLKPVFHQRRKFRLEINALPGQIRAQFASNGYAVVDEAVLRAAIVSSPRV